MHVKEIALKLGLFVYGQDENYKKNLGFVFERLKTSKTKFF
jgi:hypothetical protein